MQSYVVSVESETEEAAGDDLNFTKILNIWFNSCTHIGVEYTFFFSKHNIELNFRILLGISFLILTLNSKSAAVSRWGCQWGYALLSSNYRERGNFYTENSEFPGVA